MDDLMYWKYSPDAKADPRGELLYAMERYEQLKGKPPVLCCTSCVMRARLHEPSKKHPGAVPIEIFDPSWAVGSDFYLRGEA